MHHDELKYPILGVDIGNTSIKIFYQETEDLDHKIQVINHKRFTIDNIKLSIMHTLEKVVLTPKSICIVSVVNYLEEVMLTALKKTYLTAQFFLFKHDYCNLQIPNSYPPDTLGADRIAAALGAQSLCPNENLIVIDLGSATTIDIVNKKNHFLGGAILPGIEYSLKTLTSSTDRLQKSDIKFKTPTTSIGKSTLECINVGAYYGHIGAIKELIQQAENNCFKNKSYSIIATGGNYTYFKNCNLFHIIDNSLIFKGIKHYLKTYSLFNTAP